MSSLPPAIFLMGPTAAGKTDLALALAQVLPCELVSVDSALVYRGMDIGTAKPDKATLEAFPHHLIDIRDPADAYSAAEFRRDALDVMAKITAQGRIPLLVGGTMLYFKALCDGLADMPGANAEIRAELEARGQREGWDVLHEELRAVDAQSAARIHPNDPQRLVRALEVFKVSGMTMSELRLRQNEDSSAAGRFPYTVAQLAVAPAQRSVLHERIAQRFDLMLEQGFVTEVERLHQRGDLHAELPSIRAVGYRQVWEHLEGRLSAPLMREHGVIATRQLAKRQFTWLRSWENLHWLDSLDCDNLPRALKYLATVSILN